MRARIVIPALLLLLGGRILLAAQDVRPRGEAAMVRAEKSLLNGLASDNPGVQRSSALVLGQIRCSRAVLPLMRVLHESSDGQIRIAAAYALCRIGHSAGTFAVLRSASFDEDPRVRAHCAWYYRTLVVQGSEERSADPTTVPQGS